MCMWTEQQQSAIDAPVADTLVTAAAGSGKTAVMVERILQRVTGDNPVDIDRVLVVTYTNAAASEIKERITVKLLELIDQGAESLKQQLVLVSRASICTIHSFCLDILRSNFHLLGLDPKFRIGDGIEMELLKSQAMDEVFDTLYEAEDAAFLELVDGYTKKTDGRLVGMVRAIYEFSRSMPNPDGWLLAAERSYADGCGAAMDFLLQLAKSHAQYAVQLYDRALKICDTDPELAGWQETMAEERQMFCQFIGACDTGWDEAFSVLDGYKFAVKRRTKKAGEWEQERIKALRDEAREIYKELLYRFVPQKSAVLHADAAALLPRVQTLCELVRRYDAQYTEKKRARNLIDFSDFEHLALQLLYDESGGPSEIARGLREKFEEIYVDEYQDCNSVQEALFSAISRRQDGTPNVFMVGDLKQSIYKFRDANPWLFKSKSDSFPSYAAGMGQRQAKIVLNKNFRSRVNVLDGVNFICAQLFSEGAGELTYGEEEMLVPGADYPPSDSAVEVDVIDASVDVADMRGGKITNLQAEAAFVAQKVRAMIDGGETVTDKATGKRRPMRYRDIVILLRSTRGNAESFAQALSAQDIPCYSDVGGGYFDSYEIRTLIAFLRVVANPLDDISLATVMRCGVYGFGDNDFLAFRAEEKEGYFYDAVYAYAERHDNALAYKAQAFLDAFVRYRDAAKFMDTDEFMRYLANDTGYFAFIGTLSNPAVRRANVRALFYRAQQFESGNFKGVFNFVNFVDKLKKNGSDGDSAKVIGENEDVVRIMSIHKSKGLEFPVVFLSMCGKKFNTRDLTDAVLLHRELGLGLDYVDVQKRFAYPSAAKTAIKEKLRIEGLSEELRVLYVALTRPKERLILTGVCADVQKRLEALAQTLAGQSAPLHPRIVLGASGYLDWILLALLRHEDVLNEYDTGVRIQDNSRFCVRVVDKADIAVEPEQQPGVRDIAADTVHSAYAEEIKRRLTWEYPYQEGNKLPSNVTVTELKRLLEPVEDSDYRLFDKEEIVQPRFLETGRKVTGARAGTVMHYCMQKICLTGGAKRDTIEAEIDALCRAGLLTQPERDSVDVDKICAFLKSPVGIAMCNSPFVRREVPFKLLVDANTLFGTAAGEEIVIQGTIDAYFTDAEEKLVLVDYKTDKVRDTTDSIRQRYALQLNCYAYALEQITGKPVARKCIYLFDTGETIDV